MLKRIETKEELMQWAKEVNTGNYKYICDLQDTFAHSEEKQLKKLFVESEGYDKELIAFSISKAMGQEKLFSFMKAWALKQAQICIDENEANLDKRYSELNKSINEFEKTKQAYDNEAIKREELIESLTGKINSLKNEVEELKDHIGYQIEEIDKLRADNETLGEYVSKANEFRLYMKKTIQENNIQL